jgi:hypothetical protein
MAGPSKSITVHGMHSRIYASRITSNSGQRRCREWKGRNKIEQDWSFSSRSSTFKPLTNVAVTNGVNIYRPSGMRGSEAAN